MAAGETSEDENYVIYEDLVEQQRLKAALHYTVGCVCRELEETSFSREAIAIISETTFRHCEVLATDLEAFAKHSKRTKISVEDVKLCCRRSQSLMEFISGESEKLRAAKDEGGEEKRKKKGKKVILVDDDD